MDIELALKLPQPLKKNKKMETKTFSFLSKNLWNLVCKHRVMFMIFQIYFILVLLFFFVFFS